MAFRGLAPQHFVGTPRRPPRAGLFRVSVLAASLCTVSLSEAAPSAQEVQQARELVRSGDKKFGAGNFDGALDDFVQAHAIMQLASTGLSLARTQAQLGLLREAQSTAKSLLSLPIEQPENPVLTSARQGAALLSQELELRIPTLTPVLKRAPRDTQLTIDGEIQPTLSAPIRVNPGAHQVTLSAQGYESEAFSLTVKELEKRELVIALRPTGAPAPADPETTADSSVLAAWPYVALGVGGAGLVVGAVTGIMHLSQISDVRDDCDGDVCPSSRRQDVDSANRLATVSNVAFALSAVGITVGVLGLTIWKDGDGTEVVASTTGRSISVGGSF